MRVCRQIERGLPSTAPGTTAAFTKSQRLIRRYLDTLARLQPPAADKGVYRDLLVHSNKIYAYNNANEAASIRLGRAEKTHPSTALQRYGRVLLPLATDTRSTINDVKALHVGVCPALAGGI
jgi:hypothetical protein